MKHRGTFLSHGFSPKKVWPGLRLGYEKSRTKFLRTSNRIGTDNCRDKIGQETCAINTRGKKEKRNCGADQLQTIQHMIKSHRYTYMTKSIFSIMPTNQQTTQNGELRCTAK